MKRKKQFQALLDQYGAEALGADFVFPVKLNEQAAIETNDALQNVLAERRASLGAQERLEATLLQLRFQIEDYLNDEAFDEQKTFGYFLKAYIDSLKKKRKDFAEEINISASELSQYVNNDRKPPMYIMVRLELHSRETIPAEDWYKLTEKENLRELKANVDLRNEQRQFVIRRAEFA